MMEPVNGIYRHYKGGLYAVLGLATNSTNGPLDDAKMVLYYSLTKHRLFTRTIGEFNEKVKWPDGVTRARFEPVPGAES